jgi:hypothetical protein
MFISPIIFLECDIYGTVLLKVALHVLEPIYCVLGILILVALDCHLEGIWTFFIISVLN